MDVIRNAIDGRRRVSLTRPEQNERNGSDGYASAAYIRDGSRGYGIALYAHERAAPVPGLTIWDPTLICTWIEGGSS